MWQDEALLLDMLIAARKVRKFTKEADWRRFAGDEILQSAVMMQVQIIGEAAGRISEQTKTAHPDIPWSSIVGMRHRLVHGYSKIRLDLVWKVVEQDIQPLIETLEPLVPPEDKT